VPRKILHLDLDAFFCAVEEKSDPSLRNKAFATGGSREGRGVVTSCSYAARKYGIHSAMPMAQALRLYPDLIIVHGHFMEYRSYSKLVMRILKNLTPVVEQISIDEAFLDVSDLPSESKRIASDLQMQIYSSLGLPSSIGGASNKLVAKIATNIAKSTHTGNTYPMAIKIIPAGTEKEFLAPLPVKEMWGIGPKSGEFLNKLGIQTIGDILNFPKITLDKHFGKFADDLIRRAKGVDSRLVGDNEGIKSVSNERTFFENISEEKQLLGQIKELSEKVGKRLRKKGLAGRTIRIKIRWHGFETHTCQLTLGQATNHDSVIFSTAKELFFSIWKTGKPVRLIGIGVSKLGEDIHQLSLFNQSYIREDNLLEAIDMINKRYGDHTIRKGMKTRSDHSWKD